MMRLVAIVCIAALPACSKDEAPKAAPTAAASASATATTPAFDVESFCEKVMALPAGRKCEGDDQISEDNKIGYCNKILREAREADHVAFDHRAAERCVAAVEAALTAFDPLPDRRMIHHLTRRFHDCRETFLGKLGESAACAHSIECKPPLQCQEGTCTQLKSPPRGVPPAIPADKRKKAGEKCKASSECFGRCSPGAGHICVSYCGSD